MDVSKFLTIQAAADAVGVSRSRVYHVAKVYNWRRSVELGRRVFMAADVLKTPDVQQRRRDGQYRRYHGKTKRERPEQSGRSRRA
jgi:predicted DNA-binding transcriptional regulator AlpA